MTFTFTDVAVYFRKQLPNMLAKWKMGKSSIHKLCRPTLNRVINKGICHVSASKCNDIYLLFIELEEINVKEYNPDTLAALVTNKSTNNKAKTNRTLKR